MKTSNKNKIHSKRAKLDRILDNIFTEDSLTEKQIENILYLCHTGKLKDKYDLTVHVIQIPMDWIILDKFILNYDR